MSLLGLRPALDKDVSELRVAIAHDYLTQRGGAERVVVAMLEVFPNARLVTSVYQADSTFPEFRARAVETMALNRLSAFRRDPRLALPFLPRAFSRHTLHDIDVVLCSSSGFAHGIRATAPKIVYCHNPARWLYQPEDHLPQPVARLALRAVAPPLRKWDQRAARSGTSYLVNSTVVQQRVMRAYGRPSTVLPPPVAIDTHAARTPFDNLAPGFLLTIGRARGYKNTANVAKAMAELSGERLVVVGGQASSASDWPANVTSLGRVSDAQLRWLYANADALVAVSREDFGLTPIESYSFGTPVLALRAGGYLDTTVPGLTGRFIEGESASHVVAAVREFRAMPALDRDAITAHAQRWTKERFANDLKVAVADCVANHSAFAQPPLDQLSEPSRLRIVNADRRDQRTGGEQDPPLERRGARHHQPD